MNLRGINDYNEFEEAMIDMGDMRRKLESFGFDVFEAEGHQEEKLKEVFLNFAANGRPKAVIADTIRGYGSRTLTKEEIWFHKAPNAQELSMLCREVDEF